MLTKAIWSDKKWADSWQIRDHPFKTSAFFRGGGGVKNLPNLPTDSRKKLDPLLAAAKIRKALGDHPFMTSANFHDFLLRPPSIGSLLLLSFGKFGQFLTPSPLKNADLTSSMDDPLLVMERVCFVSIRVKFCF